MTQQDALEILKVGVKDLFESPVAVGDYRNKLKHERVTIQKFPNAVLFSFLNGQLSGGSYAGGECLGLDSSTLFDMLSEAQRDELRACYLEFIEREAE
jgi:hypothetical protein